MPAQAIRTQTQAQADLVIERMAVLRRIAERLRAAPIEGLQNVETQLDRVVEGLRPGGTFHLNVQEIELLRAFRCLPHDEHREAVVEGLRNFQASLEG